MLHDLIDLLDRQYGFLVAQNGPQFLRQLRRYLRTLSADSRLSDLMADMRREAMDLIESYRQHDAKLSSMLVALKQEFVKRVPDADDSNATDRTSVWWGETLAYFDQISATDRLHSKVNPLLNPEDPARAAILTPLLQNKIHTIRWAVRLDNGNYRKVEEDLRPDLSDLAMRVGNIERMHKAVYRDFVNDYKTSGGVALAALDDFVNNLNPPGQALQSQDDLRRAFEESWNLVWSGLNKLHDDLYDTSRGNGEAAKESVERLRPLVAIFHEDLRSRIGARRSLLGLLHRFKARCEWHDSERLRQMVIRKGVHEDDLTAELARWLFDQGLSPITRPLTGGLEPDLLDPSFKPTVYVEAKRYKSAHGARSHLRKGVFQLHDTVARLKGTPYEVHEALYVVFREGGPRYVLPDLIRGEGWVVLPVLVDIAPSAKSGSRQKDRPVVIAASEWSPCLIT